MKLIQAAVLSSLVPGATCRQFEIPEVVNIVAGIVNRFGSYFRYHGTHAEFHPMPRRADPTSTTPYWYEDITHQGISAFGPSGYVVYRNVKDYGATVGLDLIIEMQC